MHRRKFMSACAAVGSVAWAIVDAQPGTKLYRIGFLGGLPPSAAQASHLFAAFLQRMRELGYVEGRNMVFEGRYYGSQVERLPLLAAELVALDVDVIVTGAPPAPEAARRATATIPIVMTLHGDPVASGLIASLARPGGNVSGLSTVTVDATGKRLQLLKEAVPNISRLAVLQDPTFPTAPLELKEIERAARSLKMHVRLWEARDPGEFSSVFSAMTQGGADALVTIGSNTYFTHRALLVELATRSRLPSIFPVREYAEAGGLMTYGLDIRENWRRAATYVDKILKGAKPGDLPVEQASRFELIINLKTARALQLVIPPSLLQRADEVIQ